MGSRSPAELYTAAWRDFAKGLNKVWSEVGELVTSGAAPSLHELLRSLQWVPYVEAKRLLPPGDGYESKGNIGSVTGLFFELATLSIVRPLIQRELPNAIVALNWAVKGLDPSLPPRPDMSVRNGSRFAVIEIKVSPKKRDLQRAVELEARHRQAGTAYFLIGGSLSANLRILKAFEERRWATFAYPPDRHAGALAGLATLDAVMGDLVRFLRGS